MADASDLYARIRAAYPSLTNEQCVELVRKVTGISEGVTDWRRGTNVRDQRLPVGTPLATFMDRQGRPSQFYDAHQGVGAPGNNTTHAAILAGYTDDGILVAEQYVGSGGPHLQEYKYNDPRGGEKAAESYYSINTPSGAPAGERNPLKEPAGESSAYGYGIGAEAAKPAPAAAPTPARLASVPARVHAGMLARRATIGQGLGLHPRPLPGLPFAPRSAPGASVGLPVASSEGPSFGSISGSASARGGDAPLSLRYRSSVVVRVA
jgi:hypothetical protein